MFCPFLSWRINYYETMFLEFNYHIHQRVKLHYLADF